VAAAVLLGGLLAALFTWLTPPTYAATSQSFVTIGTSSDDTAGGIYQGSQFAVQRVKSYTELVDSPSVLQQVIDELHLGVSVQDLSDRVSAKSPLDTVLVEVTAEDRSSQGAARIADAVSRRLATAIEALETPQGGRSSVKVTLTQPAIAPKSPVSPRPLLNLALGILVGLAIGVGTAVTRERLDTSVRDGSQLSAAAGVPALGDVPLERGLRGRPLLALDPDSLAAEHFRTVRTNLQYVDVDEPVRQVVVTSSSAGEGKTTLACNLAISFAQAGHSVCLVESDLRRPQATAYLGLEGAVGLRDVVAGALDLDEALQSWGPNGLQVLAAGPTPPDPQAMLASAAMGRLMASLADRFQIVIYDAPPLGAVTDAAVLARRCDGAVLVARYGDTTLPELRQSRQALERVGARLRGAVMTFVPHSVSDAYTYGKSAEDRVTDRPGAHVATGTERRRRRRKVEQPGSTAATAASDAERPRADARP
jgi:capsular exopolysaccharide synthesis family protein